MTRRRLVCYLRLQAVREGEEMLGDTPENTELVPSQVAESVGAIVQRLLMGGCTSTQVRVVGAGNYGRNGKVLITGSMDPVLIPCHSAITFVALESANFDIAHAFADELLSECRKAYATICGVRFGVQALRVMDNPEIMKKYRPDYRPNDSGKAAGKDTHGA